MKLYCAGARGSVASPSCKSTGFYTDVYGGNTTCYYLEAGPFKIILDMGTGAGPLGRKLAGELSMFAPDFLGTNFITLLSHYHWDHTIGIPFFTPFYLKNNVFHFHGFNPRENKTSYVESQVKDLLSTSQATPQFPLPHRELPAYKHYTDHSPMQSEVVYYTCDIDGEYNVSSDSRAMYTRQPEIKITTIPLNHPDGCLGYRIDFENKSIAFCTDFEPQRYTCNKINTIAKNVDLAVFDGHYTEDQIAGMTQGFGHGTPKSCIEQAETCGAQNVLISHHDPANDDNILKKMEAPIHYNGHYNLFAKEGHSYDI